VYVNSAAVIITTMPVLGTLEVAAVTRPEKEIQFPQWPLPGHSYLQYVLPIWNCHSSMVLFHWRVLPLLHHCVFMGIATFLIIKYLKGPAAKQVNDKEQKRVKFIIVFLTAVWHLKPL
jgi:hypothetical protein